MDVLWLHYVNNSLTLQSFEGNGWASIFGSSLEEVVRDVKVNNVSVVDTEGNAIIDLSNKLDKLTASAGLNDNVVTLTDLGTILNGNVKLSNLALKNGEYPNMIVGNADLADNILLEDSKTTVTGTFTLRLTNNGIENSFSKGTITKILGNTLVWNLLNDGVNDINIPTGHKYIKVTGYGPYTTGSLAQWTLAVSDGTPISAFDNGMVIDLTRMYGSGNEPDSIAKFTNDFPKSYAYNSGKLISTNIEGINITGLNQYDRNSSLYGSYTRVIPSSKIKALSLDSTPTINELNGYDLQIGTLSGEALTNHTISIALQDIMYYSDAMVYYANNGETYSEIQPYESLNITLPTISEVNNLLRLRSREFTPGDYYSLGDLVNYNNTIYKYILMGGVETEWVESNWIKIEYSGLHSVGEYKDTLNAVDSGFNYSGLYLNVYNFDLGDLDWLYNSEDDFMEARPPSITTGTILSDTFETQSEAECGPSHPGITVATDAMYLRTIRVWSSDMGTDPVAFKASMSGKKANMGVSSFYEVYIPLDIINNTYKVHPNGTERIIPLGRVDSDGAPTTSPATITVEYTSDILNKIKDIDKQLVNLADLIHPLVLTTIPTNGMLPNVMYRLGTLTNSVTLSLATPSVSTITNHYFCTFNTGATAPTITWDASITSWVGGSAPTINANKHYEISVLDGIGLAMEV